MGAPSKQDHHHSESRDLQDPSRWEGDQPYSKGACVCVYMYAAHPSKGWPLCVVEEMTPSTEGTSFISPESARGARNEGNSS